MNTVSTRVKFSSMLHQHGVNRSNGQKIVIIHYLSSNCIDSGDYDNHIMHLLEILNNWKNKYDIQIQTFFIKSNNLRKDELALKDLKDRRIFSGSWKIDQINPNHESIKYFRGLGMHYPGCNDTSVFWVRGNETKILNTSGGRNKFLKPGQIFRILDDISDDPSILERKIYNWKLFTKYLG
jgi:hypothetical protein